jgi:hypothetical protein
VIHPVAELRRGRGLHQGGLLNTEEIQNMARQNHVGGKVALMGGFGYTTTDVIPERLEIMQRG